MPSVTVGFVPTKRRPRFGNGRVYEDPRNTQQERLVRQAWESQTGGWSAGESPVVVRIDVHRALPNGRPKRIESEPDARKPDADNIAKSVLDALNGAAYEDDKQVVALVVVKHDRRRRDGDVMRIEVTKWE